MSALKPVSTRMTPRIAHIFQTLFNKPLATSKSIKQSYAGASFSDVSWRITFAALKRQGFIDSTFAESKADATEHERRYCHCASYFLTPLGVDYYQEKLDKLKRQQSVSGKQHKKLP